ncbi:MAG: histidinol dehydrogenase [Halioglobus sp.]|jgi:histidinol dehydrogenase
MQIQRLDTSEPQFFDQLAELTNWHEAMDAGVESVVDEIIADVIARGDAAVLEYTARFDRVCENSVAALEVSAERMLQALEAIEPREREALEQAAARIRSFHEHQVQDSWRYTDEQGNVLGQRVTPIARAGVYVPGGKASYPSSVLMNVLPAKVARVGEVVMVVPAPDGKLSELVLAAAQIAGVDRLFKIGGAQAVAAMAYGTETVPQVDKIVGPGNSYVATAKRKVFGQVGIDMVAGPSEILIVCDGNTDPDWVAMDMFAQSEHDENAQAILLCPDANYLSAVSASIDRLLPSMERKEVIAASLAGRGALIKTRDLKDAIVVSNRIAPEHLELSVEDPEALLSLVEHAGAIFMGPYTSESLGDYCAGPNHVLPTWRTARFSSPLGVYDFQKRSSIIMCSDSGVQKLGKITSVLARGESLTAHARSAELRLKDPL